MYESWERGSSFPDLLPRVRRATFPELLRECTQVSLIHVQRGKIFMLGAKEKCPHVIFMQMKGCFSIFPPTQSIPVLLGKVRLLLCTNKPLLTFKTLFWCPHKGILQNYTQPVLHVLHPCSSPSNPKPLHHFHPSWLDEQAALSNPVLNHPKAL